MELGSGFFIWQLTWTWQQPYEVDTVDEDSETYGL